MTPRHETLTITLHWVAALGEQTTTVVCEDSPPIQLVPLLLTGCGLPASNDGGGARHYTLRLGAADGRLLPLGEPVSLSGVRSGSHLWLGEGGVGTRTRCLLGLPDGSEATLPRRGAPLTRAWLLQLLALLHPEAHKREVELLERRESLYRYVSNKPHCTIAPGVGGVWAVSTSRVDVTTLLNGTRLFPDAPEPLRDGDYLTLGDGGPTLVVSLLEGLDHRM